MAKEAEKTKLEENIEEITKMFREQEEYFDHEQDVKEVLVNSFIEALGYNPKRISEVKYEKNAGEDVGRVDIAMQKDYKPLFIIECKSLNNKLEKSVKQLRKYFSSMNEVRIGVLTNGITYNFFSDIEKENVMDSTPFFKLDIRNIDNDGIKLLNMVCKDNFVIADILKLAKELKCKEKLKNLITKELTKPSHDFVTYFSRQLYGSANKEHIDLCKPHILPIINDFINDKMSGKLKHLTLSQQEVDDKEDAGDTSLFPITSEVLEAYWIVKCIIKMMDTDMLIDCVKYRPTYSYVGINYTDGREVAICRLFFASYTKKEIRIKINTKGDNWNRYEISSVTDIFKYKEDIENIVKDIMNKRKKQ